jgi:glycosyltransferase involved in cell wall biosynthesis
MRIAILAHSLHVAGGRIVGVNMIASMKRMDQANFYLFVVPDQAEYRALGLGDGRHRVHYYRRQWGLLGRVFFEILTMRRLINRFQPNVVFGMGNLGLFFPPCPQAILLQQAYFVYDVRERGALLPAHPLQSIFARRCFTWQLPVTQLVICQTATMERRLRNVYRYKGRTVVVQNAMSFKAGSIPSGAVVPAWLGASSGKFKLFYPTRYYRHKGLEMLFDVMESCSEELSNTVAVITIEAGQHGNAARLLKHIRKRTLQDRIVNVGPLAPEALPAYYLACNCLVMPTRLETLSGTYLEAMHFGLPILTSDLDFAHEVCGDAALYFNPLDARSMKDAILRIKGDPDLRIKLAHKGRERLSKCYGRTWDDIAGEVKKALDQLGISDKSR